MGLFGYSGKGFGNIVDIAFRNVIRFYWLKYKPLTKLDPYLRWWTLTVAVEMQQGRKWSLQLKNDQIWTSVTPSIPLAIIV
jgi:hypothetical protein